ncbi:GAF domain-containing protein [Hydrocarboniphaga sp.]|uniref:GAF domain-containing protein n=1 Tax=Hydrocarboniphaga sp. TaxID=2033016 RepID=UPI002627B4FE|nr:GAF domain-containing protein [Hydrocarboniphaga sp.]
MLEPTADVGPELVVAEAAGTEGAAQALRGILHTATELLGATRGFLLICNDAGVMEVACVREMRPVDVMDLVLTQASLVVRTVLRERQPVAADELGRAFQFEANAADSRRAAIFCMPLDLGDRRSGLFCALRGTDAAVIGGLDLEILHGLCDQASLVIGATSACTALAQLEACIKAGSLSLPRILI